MKEKGMPRRIPANWLPVILIVVGAILLGGGLFRLFSGAPAAITEGPAMATAATSPAEAAAPPASPTPVAPTPQSPVPTPTATVEVNPSEVTEQRPAAIPAAETLDFDGERAYEYVLAQEALGPRPTGSEAGWATGDFIIEALDDGKWTVETQEFVFRGVQGRNIIARAGRGPVIILGAHYDTRPVADHDPDETRRQQPILGANDGASGVAVLLELARALDVDRLQAEVWLAFFDAEDRGRLDGWPFSVGARHMAQSLVVRPEAVVVVDMIGDADQNIHYEVNSDPALSQEIWGVAGALGFEEFLIPTEKYAIIDDHTPFLEQGIPAVDMIDFDYPYWHTLADTADKVSGDSLARVGLTLEAWLEAK